MNANNTTGVNEQITQCIITEDPLAAKVCKTLAYCLLLVVSLMGNTLIIMVVYRDDKMKTTTNLLIVNMAVSDLLVPIFAMPRANVEILYGNLRWLIDGGFGEALCKLTAFFQDISTAVSVQTLVAIAFDRFYAVWFPLKAARIKPRSYRRGFLAIFSRIFCSCGSMCQWIHEVDVSSRFGQESYVASAGTVNTGMDFETKDVVLTSIRSLESVEHKAVENVNIETESEAKN
ncbi:hypothetical protein ACROYT_G011674 [Oculina patagonica]